MSLRSKKKKKKSANRMMPDPPANFSFETHLAEELLKLSCDERLEIEEEIHGVGCRAVIETPELVLDSLARFDVQLNDRKETEAHRSFLRNVARTSSSHPSGTIPAHRSCYLNDPEVRIRFLRCERYVVEQAVQRFLDFLEFMAELFGDFVADRPVQFSDFKKEEKTALINSRNHLLPFRDRSGRRVFASVGKCNFHLSPAIRNKISMYLWWVASEDIDTQRRGVVVVTYVFDEADDCSWEKVLRPGLRKNEGEYQTKKYNAIPVRIASWQQYYPDTPYFRALAALYLYTAADFRYRSIFRIHFGQQTDIFNKMASYGVPVDLVPVSCTGTIKLANHHAWLGVQRTLSDPRETAGLEIVECPRPFDVVFRKGANFRNSPGNEYYRELLESFSMNHWKGNKKTKTKITNLIIDEMESHEGRFLEWLHDRDMWVVIQDREKVRTKIAAAFKQFNRSRRQRILQQLARTIDNSIAVDDSGDNGKKKKKKYEVIPDEAKSIRQYYSKGCSRHLVGSPLSILSREGSDLIEGDNNDDDSDCFGKVFFPTAEGTPL